MNPLLEGLHDIEGLDLISSWPLSIGWWILLSLGILILAAGIYWIIRTVAFRRSWKNDTFLKLEALEKNLSDATARETALALSEYVRRIALKRYSRQKCAGLFGDSWLKWLSAHDPKQFDWEAKGAFLMEVPYAPVTALVSTSQIKDLIQAVREWVH